MSNVIPIRRGAGPLRPLAKASPLYPEPGDGIHLIADGDDWFLVRNRGGQSVEMRLTHQELLRIGDAIELVTAMKEDV